MKNTYLFRTLLAVFLAIVLALSVGAFTPEAVETAAEAEGGFSDAALADAKKDDMKMRRDIMNQDGVSIVVSIHMNKFSDTSIKGPMAFYMKGSAEGERLATSIICALCDALGNPRRLANPGDYFVIRESVPPAVIVECGFLSNADDEKLLQTAEHQSKLVEGIAAGITAYFGGGE